MRNCLSCGTEVEKHEGILCTPCSKIEFDNEKDVNEFMEKLGGQCKSCNVSTSTLTDGLCNVCKACQDKEDMVERPSHYNMGKIQPIDVIEDWKLDFRLASALKYIARAGRKDPEKTRQDLEKCIWYVQRYIDKELL